MPRRAKTFLLSVLVAASAISFAEQVNAYATETASREVAAAVMQSRLDTPREFYDPEIPPFLAYRLRPSLVSTSHSNGNVVAFKR